MCSGESGAFSAGGRGFGVGLAIAGALTSCSFEPRQYEPWPFSKSVADCRWSAPGTEEDEEEMKKMTIRALFD